MRNYEILTVLPGTLAENEVDPVVDNIKKLIESEGITNVAIEAAGKSRLAYPMKHIRYGYFHIFTFEAEPAVINKIEEKLRLFGQILRTIIRIFDPSKRDASKGSQFTLMSTEDEKNDQKEHFQGENHERTDRQEAPTPVAPPVMATPATEESTPVKMSEDKPKEVNMQEFDKQLEAILDDKIAGL